MSAMKLRLQGSIYNSGFFSLEFHYRREGDESIRLQPNKERPRYAGFTLSLPPVRRHTQLCIPNHMLPANLGQQDLSCLLSNRAFRD